MRMRTRMRMSECQDARMPVPKMLPLLSQAPRQKFPSSSICKDKLGVRGPASGAWSLGSNFNNSQVQWSVLPTANVLVAPGPATRSCEMKSKPSFHHFIWHFLHFFFFSALSLHLLFIYFFSFLSCNILLANTHFPLFALSPLPLPLSQCVRVCANFAFTLGKDFCSEWKASESKKFYLHSFLFLKLLLWKSPPPRPASETASLQFAQTSLKIYMYVRAYVRASYVLRVYAARQKLPQTGENCSMLLSARLENFLHLPAKTRENGKFL